MRGQAEPRGQGFDEAPRVGVGVGVRLALIGEQRRVLPARHAIGTPADRQRPARQLLARIPLALAKVQEAALAILRAQLLHQFGGQPALGGAERVGIPLSALTVARGDEGGLPAHRQAHVHLLQGAVDGGAGRIDGHPLRLGIGLGHARGLIDARDRHMVLEGDLALVHRPAHRRGAAGLRRAGQRDVPLPGQQPGGGVQPDPAGAGQVDLAPGVEVSEIGLGAHRAIHGLHVGRQLQQVTGDEARRQPKMAQRLHQ
ncbi:hypothetical protein LMG19282_05132 [Cupriavidus campinensis]|nr:hypothetical protein LMG19282_05132 [Cupriavidus campinensis]